MTDPIGTAQERRFLPEDELEIIDALRGWAKNLRSGQDQAWLEEAADALQSRIAEGEAMREALELFTGQAVFDPHTHRASVDEFVVSKARAALSLHRRPT